MTTTDSSREFLGGLALVKYLSVFIIFFNKVLVSILRQGGIIASSENSEGPFT